MIEPKFAGGIGLGNLDFEDWVLLAKWWWRFGEKSVALWRMVIAMGKMGRDDFLDITCRVCGETF